MQNRVYVIGERDTLRGNAIEISLYLLASERSERDTYRGNTIENRGLFIYLYICMDVCMSFCTLTLTFLC